MANLEATKRKLQTNTSLSNRSPIPMQGQQEEELLHDRSLLTEQGNCVGDEEGDDGSDSSDENNV